MPMYFKLIRGDTLSPTFDNRKCEVNPGAVAGGAGSGAAAGSAFGPWGTVIGAGIGAIGSIAGGLIGNSAAKGNARLQAQLQQEMIDKQNAYNTPANQRARLEAAGINPYLAMSGGALGSGQQMQSGTIQPIDSSALPNGIMAASQMMGNAALMAAQVRNMNAEAAGKEIDNLSKQNINEEQLNLLKQQVNGQSIVNAAAQYDLEKMKPAELMKLQGEVDKLSHETALLLQKGTTEALNQGLLVKQIEQLGLSNKQARAVLPYVIKSAELENKEQQMRVSTGYQNAFTNRLNAYAAQTSADAATSNALTNQNVGSAQVGLINAQANGQRWKNRLSAKENYWQPRLWKLQEELGISNAANAWSNTVLNGTSQILQSLNPIPGLENVNTSTTHYDAKGRVRGKTVTSRSNKYKNLRLWR